MNTPIANTPIAVYIAPPATERGRWRVTCDGRPAQELPDREEAVRHAVGYARKMEAAGRTVVVKLERPDGSWVVYRG